MKRLALLAAMTLAGCQTTGEQAARAAACAAAAATIAEWKHAAAGGSREAPARVALAVAQAAAEEAVRLGCAAPVVASQKQE